MSSIKSKPFISSHFTLGIIAGGQLGKMLAQVCNNWDVKTKVLDSEIDAPASGVCNEFQQGSFASYQDVYNFGKTVDLLTLELEHVNIQALLDLQKEGLEIHPNPQKLQIIQDKGLQKAFFEQHNLPSTPYTLVSSKEELIQKIAQGHVSFPFVQKSRTLGYDGKGVTIIRSKQDLNQCFDVPSVIEPLVEIEKELSIIAAQNKEGEMAIYPAVEMLFNPAGNLVDLLLCPANISSEISHQATELAQKVMKAFQIQGLLAVEMFLDKQGKLWINEVAPRPHNSGHHTIESNMTSQFEQHLRAILNYPLGSTQVISPSVMLNLLGDPQATGPVYYQNIETCMAVEGAKFHIYGKKTTKPLRKMGHVSILSQSTAEALEKAQYIKNTLKITSHG